MFAENLINNGVFEFHDISHVYLDCSVIEPDFMISKSNLHIEIFRTCLYNSS